MLAPNHPQDRCFDPTGHRAPPEHGAGPHWATACDSSVGAASPRHALKQSCVHSTLQLMTSGWKVPCRPHLGPLNPRPPPHAFCGSAALAQKILRVYVDAFELWCWRRLLRVPWTTTRSNQSILKEIGPEYSLKGLMLKLKLQYFGHLMRRADSLEKTLMLGKTGGRRRGGRQDEMAGWRHRLNGHEFEQTRGDSEGQRSLVGYRTREHKESDTA